MEMRKADGPLIMTDFTLDQIQALNDQIYGRNNKLFFDPMRIAARMSRFGGRLNKAFRFKNRDAASFHIAMELSWSMAMANKLGIESIQDELWKRFPGICSHCKFPVCRCDEGGTPSVIPAMARPQTLRELQAMFKRIYPNNTLSKEREHLLEEICEVEEAVDNFTATSLSKHYLHLVAELLDTIAHTIGVANCAEMDLASNSQIYFANGCYVCHRNPCTWQTCGFPDANTVSPDRRRDTFPASVTASPEKMG